jgi:Rrf2 family protein
MLRLSKKSDYALIAMAHLAARLDGSGSSSAREISEAYAIPLELLAKILQRLVRAKLLVSVQGTRGGYRLARPAAAISVADVIQSVDGPVTVTACSPDDHACDQFGTCSIRDPLWKIKNRILDTLTTVSVAELGADAAQAAQASALPPAPKISRMVFVSPIGES